MSPRLISLKKEMKKYKVYLHALSDFEHIRF
jgi:hypothetical protein